MTLIVTGQVISCCTLISRVKTKDKGLRSKYGLPIVYMYIMLLYT